MEEPIYVYLYLEGLYQNHRLYEKSLNYAQLRGEDISEKDMEKYGCAGYSRIEDMQINQGILTNVNLNPDDTANPCGLMAKTIFNDTFVLFDEEAQQKLEVDIKFDDINYDIDMNTKFEKLDDGKG